MLAKYPDKIAEVGDESSTGDGYWLYLKDGWCWQGEVHSVHEWNMKDLLKAWGDVQPCDCEDCQKALAKKAQ